MGREVTSATGRDNEASPAMPLKPIPVLLAAWAFAGFGAVIGSILGRSAGKPGLFAGAVLGGVLGISAAIAVLTKLHWLSPGDRTSAFLGGIVGFGIAVPIAVTHLHTPIAPIFSCGLVGAGLLAGVGLARGWKR
jgi:hypothetical protein